MTIDEHIKKAEEDAKQAEFDTEWGIGNYFIDRTEALEYAKECRQLAEWLRELQRWREFGGRIANVCASYITEEQKEKLLEIMEVNADDSNGTN